MGVPIPLPRKDLQLIASVVRRFKQSALQRGAVTGWWGNAKTHFGATGGCSWWAAKVVHALEANAEIAAKYEFGVVSGLRNISSALLLTFLGEPTLPAPMPHFVAVIWPRGTDPNDTGVYIDAWAETTKYGPIQEFTFQYSWALTGTPTIESYSKKHGYRRIPLLKGNPWVF